MNRQRCIKVITQQQQKTMGINGVLRNKIYWEKMVNVALGFFNNWIDNLLFLIPSQIIAYNKNQWKILFTLMHEDYTILS